MKRLVVSVMALTLVVACPAAPVRAQNDALIMESDEDVRIRAWITLRARREADLSVWGGISFVTLGALGGALGVGQLAARDSLDPGYAPAIATLTFAGGLVMLTNGILMLAVSGSAVDLAASLPDGPLDARAIGRLEGHLEAAAEAATATRIATGVLGGSAVLAGGLGVGLMAANDLAAGDYLADYLLSAGTALAGLVAIIVACFESPAEADLREYRSGWAPRAAAVRVEGSPLGLQVTY